MHMMTINIKSTLFTFAFSLALAPLAHALELVMVEQPGCIYCQKWDEEVAHKYPLTELGKAAPLRRIDISESDQNLQLEKKIIFTPTFLFVENGKEVKRFEGYISEDFFWSLSEEFLENYQAKE